MVRENKNFTFRNNVKRKTNLVCLSCWAQYQLRHDGEVIAICLDGRGIMCALIN